MNNQERATCSTPRGILKSTPSHRPRASSSSHQARHVKMTSDSSLDNNMTGLTARTDIPSRRHTWSEGDVRKSARKQPRWIQLLLSTFSIKNAKSTAPIACSARVHPAPRRSDTPRRHQERISTSQISLPHALGARNRTSCGNDQLPGPSSHARTSHRRVRSVSPKQRGATAGASRHLGSFDFERNNWTSRAA
jgi:hypothetical protein